MSELLNRLTAKQEAFCQKYIELGEGNAAYRAAYNPTKRTDSVYISHKVKDLLSGRCGKGLIALRIEELRKEQAERNAITAEFITSQLLEVAQEARAARQYSAASQCLQGVAKINGLVIDQVNATNTNYVVGIKPSDSKETPKDKQAVEDEFDAKYGTTMGVVSATGTANGTGRVPLQ